MSDDFPTSYEIFPDVQRRNYLQEQLEVPALVRLLDLPKGGAVLEVGCGRGVALPPLARLLQPEKLAGLDIEPALIEIASAHVEESEVTAALFVGDVRRMPFGDASFDVVIDFGTCHHISGPDFALKEIVRVLRPGGLFVAESLANQLLSHPLRTRGRRLPWKKVPQLTVSKQGMLWKVRVRDI